jgi:predicted TIM-barrel fold metal-dependent hydrolase
VSKFPIDPFIAEVASWDLFDANARVGPSGIYGERALHSAGLLEEMDRFGIRRAIVSHWTAEEYDAEAGHRALERDLDPRFIPAWAALPDSDFVDALAKRRPQAVRLTPSLNQHNFSLSPWCAGELLEFLQSASVITLISRADIEWDRLEALLGGFQQLVVVLVDTGYRADRYLLPLLKKFPQLYFDSATYLAHRQLETFVERHGADRLLFGSRLPLYSPASALGVLASARISDEARLAVAGGNLRRLLAQCKNQPEEVAP